MFEPRVCLPALGGKVDINLTADSTQNQLLEQHGAANKRNVELLILSWCSLLSDSPVDSPKPAKVLIKFRQSLVGDLFKVIRCFSDLANELVNSLERDEAGDPSIGVYLKGMEKTPVYREYRSFLETRDPHTLTFLLSFLWFGKKSYYEDEAFNTTALRGWEEVEERLGSLVLPSWISNLRVIIDALMREFDSDFFLPSHGNGRVAEPGIHGTELKNITFGTHPMIEYMYRKKSIFVIDETSIEVFPGNSSDERMLSRSVSRLKFVPKDYKTSRSICMEPTVFMWAQQGVRLWLERAISEGRLKNHVVLSDQTRNQEASRLGSLTGTLDTIDLSSASDSVKWDLVKQVFPPGVLKHLHATRTRLVELPDGSVRSVNKYAPMGSALCFPVQSTIYAAVCILAAIAEVHGVDWSTPIPNFSENVDSLLDWTFCERGRDKGDGLVQEFLAYGDDIVVDTRTTSTVIEMLVSLGFKVNVAKSFIGPKQAFRESCGEFHYLGQTVTPYFFKTKKLREEVEIDALAGVLEHANKARRFGYVQLRKTLIQYSLRTRIAGMRGEPETNPILFTTDEEESMAILCDIPRNDHLTKRSWKGIKPDAPSAGEAPMNLVRSSLLALIRSRASVDDERREVTSSEVDSGRSCDRLQRDEVRSITLRPVRGLELSESYDNYRYMCWWRSRYGQEKGTAEITAAPPEAETAGVAVGMRWTAC